MEDRVITSVMRVCKPSELADADRRLAELAMQATHASYAPYSRFHVGCAVLLANGHTVTGCNQENAAFSVTICAERTALFAAGAQWPGEPVVAVAIAARNADGLLPTPVSPCGVCRQAMVEAETRSRRKLHIILCGADCAYVMDGIETLLPLSFSDEQM